MLLKYNVADLIFQCSFKRIGTQHRLLYHAKWSGKKSQHFVHNYEKIMIMKELQKCFGEIYLGGKNNFY